MKRLKSTFRIIKTIKFFYIQTFFDLNNCSFNIDFYEAIALEYVDISKMFIATKPQERVTMETDKLKLSK